MKSARPKLLSANATVTKCKMDWNTVSTSRTFWNFPLYYKTLLHSEAFTELHVYSCKRMYIASALFYCNSNRISHTNRCVSQFSVLDVGQILIIHKKIKKLNNFFFLHNDHLLRMSIVCKSKISVTYSVTLLFS